LDNTTGDEDNFDLLCLLDVHSGDTLGDRCLDGDTAFAAFFDRRVSLDDGGEYFLISADDLCLGSSRESTTRSLSWRDRLSPVDIAALLFSLRRAAAGRGLRLELFDLLQDYQHFSVIAVQNTYHNVAPL